MSDIVERLKRGESCLEGGRQTCVSMNAVNGCLCAIAADEIVRLTAEMKRLTEQKIAFIGEIDRLRETQRTVLVEQGESVARLTSENEKLGRDYQSARDAHDKVLAENERLRAALKQIAGIDPWDDGEQGYVDKARAALTQPMKLYIDNEKFLAAIDREGDHEVGAGNFPPLQEPRT
jgi:hypothetical protein